MPDKRLYPGRAAEHGFQIRKVGKRIEIGMHKGEIFDIPQLARIGPNANFQIRKLFLERVAPCLGVADMFVEIDDEQRHNRLLKPWDNHCSETQLFSYTTATSRTPKGQGERPGAAAPHLQAG